MQPHGSVQEQYNFGRPEYYPGELDMIVAHEEHLAAHGFPIPVLGDPGIIEDGWHLVLRPVRGENGETVWMYT